MVDYQSKIALCSPGEDSHQDKWNLILLQFYWGLRSYLLMIFISFVMNAIYNFALNIFRKECSFFGDGSEKNEVNIPVPCLTKRHVILPQILEQNRNKPHRQHVSDQPSKSHVLKELRKWIYGSRQLFS